MDELVKLKAELSALSREVYGNTQTEIILEQF